MLNKSDTFKKLGQILKKETGIDIEEINPNQSIREQTNLDSMQFISLIARAENVFGIELPMSVMLVNTLNEFTILLSNELCSE